MAVLDTAILLAMRGSSPRMTYLGTSPRSKTGLGAWTDEQIVATAQKGTRPHGRMLAPIMPWRGLANLTAADVKAIVAYLRGVPPGGN
jgi:hypothetical protein